MSLVLVLHELDGLLESNLRGNEESAIEVRIT